MTQAEMASAIAVAGPKACTRKHDGVSKAVCTADKGMHELHNDKVCNS